jgi:hypothetical protein
MPKSTSDPASISVVVEITSDTHSAAIPAASSVRPLANVGARSSLIRSGLGAAGGRASMGSSRKLARVGG